MFYIVYIFYLSALHFVGKRGAIFFDFRCIFLKKYFADILINCIFVYQIKLIKTKSYENNKQNNVADNRKRKIFSR